MEELIKKSNKYLIIYLLVAFVGTFIPLIPGAFLLDADSNSILGIILMILSGVILLSSTVIYCLIGPKLTRQINEEKAKRDLVKLQTKTGNRIYKTLNGEEIEFSSDFFTVDGKMHYYDKYSCLGYFRFDEKQLIPCIILGISDEEPFVIDLDGDLLDILEESKLNILNKVELDFYINNIKEAIKQVNKTYSFTPQPYLPMEFKKNKTDAKKFRNRNLIYILFSIGFFVLSIAFYVLILWLGDSKEGIEFSNKIGMDIIIKIIFSIVLILLIFVKSGKYSIYSKVITGLYVIIFWLSRILLDTRANLLIDYIFMIIFMLVGAFEVYRIKKSEKKAKDLFNRYFGIAVFIALGQTFTALLDFTFVKWGLPWLYALFGDLIILSIAAFILILYLRKQKEKTKKEKVSLILSVLFGILFAGYYFSIVTVSNLNFALDNSKPIINSYEILELENGDDNENDSAKVIINGVEYEISISDYEYETLKVGDMLEVYYYEGAFGLSYYIHYSE